jgi:glycosyltransferase involved in cell wall biosynthesis
MNSTSRVLILFNSMELYGMERAVIETFSLLRPDVEPTFLMSQTAFQRKLPVFREVVLRVLPYQFLSDKGGWPRLQRPKSMLEFLLMLRAIVLGNLYSLRVALKHDMLYIPSLQHFYLGLFAALMYRLSGRRVIFHFHNLYVRPAILLKLLAPLVTHYVHNTRYGLDRTVRAYPYVAGRSQVVAPCTEIAGSATVMESLGSEFKGRFNILFVGQVSTHKGIDILLKAYQIVDTEVPNTVLHIVGGCDKDVDATFGRLATQFKRGSIRHWGYRNDVAAFFHMSSVYVHPTPPSRCAESLGRGVIEAMSASIPVVCFRSGALEEVVVQGETGLICTEESAECLASNICRIAGNEKLARQLGDNGRRRFEDLFSAGSIRNKWLRFIDWTEAG